MSDVNQIKQILINLLKNAAEVSPNRPSEINLDMINDQLDITLRDFGQGMVQDVRQKTFLAYFSTKTESSGIGLSVCREVMDAHQGQISLKNHP